MLAPTSTLSSRGHYFSQYGVRLHTALWLLMLAGASVGAPLDDKAACVTTIWKDVPVLLQSLATRSMALRAAKSSGETIILSQEDMDSVSTGRASHDQPGAPVDPDADFVRDPDEDAENLPTGSGTATGSYWRRGGKSMSSSGAASGGSGTSAGSYWRRGGKTMSSSGAASGGSTVSSGSAWSDGSTESSGTSILPDWLKFNWTGGGDTRKYSHTSADGRTHTYHARRKLRRRLVRSGMSHSRSSMSGSRSSGAYGASGMAGGGRSMSSSRSSMSGSSSSGAYGASGMAGGGGSMSSSRSSMSGSRSSSGAYGASGMAGGGGSMGSSGSSSAASGAAGMAGAAGAAGMTGAAGMSGGGGALGGGEESEGGEMAGEGGMSGGDGDSGGGGAPGFGIGGAPDAAGGGPARADGIARAMTKYRWKFNGKTYTYTAPSPIKDCTTRQDPSETTSDSSMSPVGTPCLFGVDDRDEGKHCIMDDSKGSSSEFGWCFTTDDKAEWGLCSANCPVFGKSKVLNDRLTVLGIKVQALLAKVREMPDYCKEKGCKIEGKKSTSKKKKKTWEEIYR